MISIAHHNLHVNRSPVPSREQSNSGHPSQQLLSANEQLLARRSINGFGLSRGSTQQVDVDTKQLPPHLGWGNAMLSAVVPPQTIRHAVQPTTRLLQLSAETTPDPAAKPETVKVYPSLLTAMLKQGIAAIGRIWLLCRALDQAGRGWLHIDQLRIELTRKLSDWHIVGWRRLRQLLQEGKEVLWERDQFGRIWLYGAAHVAQNLGVLQLEGNPVALPIESLIDGLRSTKAAFYAAFHAGRKRANPISRATLRTVTGSGETTQRSYEACGKMTVTANYCVSRLRYTPENVRAEAYKRPAIFAITDRQTGKQQIAWPLPNNYQTTLQTACCGRQRKINRQLKSASDLVIQGRGGTDGDFGRIFCVNGKQAMQGSQTNDRYWQEGKRYWFCT